MKLDAAEHARVFENQGGAGGFEDEVFVSGGHVRKRCDAEVTAHAEVDAEPGIAGKVEEHLLRGGGRGEEFRAGERPAERGGVGAAEDFGVRMQLNCRDPPAGGGAVPALAEEFDLGEFGHRK
jgi:hypothetical protein